MKNILLLLLLSISVYATEYKVIYNLQSGDEALVNKSIIQGIPQLQKHYTSQGNSLKVVVIISNKAYKFFIKELHNRSDVKVTAALQSRIATKMKKIQESGVRFEICSMGMKKHKIDTKILYNYVHPAFNRTASLIEWQNKGYAIVDVL